MTEKKEYFYNIDILRIALVILIVYYHFIRMSFAQDYDISLLHNLAKNVSYSGAIGNGALFIVSGYFLYSSFLRHKESFLVFATRKLIRFWPVLLFAVIIMGILGVFGLTHFDIGQNILNLFLITRGGGGLTTKLTNLNVTWFVCALFWCSLFYYALYISIKDKFKFNFITCLITYFGLVLYINSPLKDIEVIHGIFSKGGTLAMSHIGLGMLINIFLSGFDKIKINYMIASILEIGISVYLIWGCIFKKFQENYIFIIITFCILFVLFLLNSGMLSKILNNKIFSKIGRYAFAIYITQEISFVFFRNYLWKQAAMVTSHPVGIIFLSIFCSVLLGIITYHLVEEPSVKFLKKNLLEKLDNAAISGGG